MQIDLSKPRKIVVRREIFDTMRFRDDSHFLYHVKKALQDRGNDCIKKLAWKDGNLVDNHMHYIRERRFGYIVWDANYAIRSCAEVFNKTGEVELDRDGEGIK